MIRMVASPIVFRIIWIRTGLLVPPDLDDRLPRLRRKILEPVTVEAASDISEDRHLLFTRCHRGGDIELLDGPVDDVLIRGISFPEGGECLQDLQAASVVIGYAVHGSASSFVYDNVFRDI